MKEFCVIIPAIKKNVAFHDDLVKKLNGVSLIQRAIDTALKITDADNVFVVTDSEEIALICLRAEVNCLPDKTLKFHSLNIIKELKPILVNIDKVYENVIVLWPYAPLISEKQIRQAYSSFCQDGSDFLTTLKEEYHRIYKEENHSSLSLVSDAGREKFLVEVKAFLIAKSAAIRNGEDMPNIKIQPFIMPDDIVEIKTYQDWWICEKLLNRKRVVFRIIGYDEVGMGHIYRAMTIAHEITDHEVVLLCDERSHVTVNRLAGYDYHIEAAKEDELLKKLLSLKPDLVINDILNTDKDYIQALKENMIKVVNFEDLGSGAEFADLTINELYDEPIMPGKNIRWGHKYFFLRDEFAAAKAHKFKAKVDSLLITFGGTDQNNLTKKTLSTILDFCRLKHIKIYVVTGPGYVHKEDLMSYLATVDSKNIEFTYATGVMSAIMEKAQIAISSNGRTVYELAHMNIPSIIISQHERENTHCFTREENGFINIGVYDSEFEEELILKKLEELVSNNAFRKNLFSRMTKFSFHKNKSSVVKNILRLLE